ncbi:MAG: hypothetical protein LBB63_04200 [Holosporaceae bacterium]|jgi:hypothetical protein|nr:hypothetical protein [Holosporaceae bacterium]
MKQILTPEDLNLLEEKLKSATALPWNVVEDDGVGTAWVIPDVDGNPIALFDYHSEAQNKADAGFVAYARNYMPVLLQEVKNLRKRILELIQSNNNELQRRLDLQTEVNELRKVLENRE